MQGDGYQDYKRGTRNHVLVHTKLQSNYLCHEYPKAMSHNEAGITFLQDTIFFDYFI